MTFLEGLLLRLSYIIMLAMVIICDLAALVVSLRGLSGLPRPSWVVVSVVLLLVVWNAGTQDAILTG